MKGNRLLLSARHIRASGAPYSEERSARPPMQATPAPFAHEGPLPSLERAALWLNSSPITAANLRGKVVLINFCTYTCINWLRSLPYVRAWAEKYQEQGLVVIGVHTPEFSFEHDHENVRLAVRERRIAYPLVLDNAYAIWQAFANHYWPALYFFDAQGRLRHHHFGEGQYEQSELVLQHLLSEAGERGGAQEPVAVEAEGAEAPADWDDLWSAETYLGFERAEHFASPGGAVAGKRRIYSAPARVRLKHWALAGDWTVQGEAAVLNKANGRIVSGFHARDLHLVLAPTQPGTIVHFRVRIDGRPPGAAHGSDIDEQGNGIVSQARLYQLVRQARPIVDRQFEIEFLEAGVEAFVFTFG